MIFVQVAYRFFDLKMLYLKSKEVIILTAQVEKLMRILQISEEEALQVIADDKAIDRGQKMDFDLTPAEEKATRKYRQADRQPTVYNFQKRDRKPNEVKRDLISLLEKALSENGAESIEITNIERQIDFIVNGTKYRIVLSAPRK